MPKLRQTFIAGVIIGIILGAVAVAIETGGEQMYNHEHYRDDTAGLAIAAADRARRELVIRRLRGYPYLQRQLAQKQELRSALYKALDGIRSPALSDMPHGTDVGDPVYRQTLRLPVCRQEIAEVEQEIGDIMAEINAIEHMLSQLRPVQQEIIRARYMRTGRPESTSRIATRLYYSDSTVKRQCKKAIDFLAKMKK